MANICSNKKLCKDLNCLKCFKKSFASNQNSKYLIDNINPRFIFKSTVKKYNFRCNYCSHIFNKSCNKIAAGQWCQYCANKRLCKDLDCKICFKKSFANHKKSKYLVDDINPRLIFKVSYKKYNFKCDKCFHIFNKSCGSINRGQWCPFCVNKRLCKDLECKICFKKSFVSHPKSKYLVDDINLRFVFKSSKNKYNFKCNDCYNIFNMRCSSINEGQWCPICINKTEKKVYKWLLKEYNNYNIIREKKFLKLGKKRFDFYIEELNIIIEIDGEQHFKEIKYWNTDLEKSFENDVLKTQFCLDNNTSIIRINQDDIWKDKIDWKNILKNNLKKYEKSILLCFESMNKNNYEKIKNCF